MIVSSTSLNYNNIYTKEKIDAFIEEAADSNFNDSELFVYVNKDGSLSNKIINNFSVYGFSINLNKIGNSEFKEVKRTNSNIVSLSDNEKELVRSTLFRSIKRQSAPAHNEFLENELQDEFNYNLMNLDLETNLFRQMNYIDEVSKVKCYLSDWKFSEDDEKKVYDQFFMNNQLIVNNLFIEYVFNNDTLLNKCIRSLSKDRRLKLYKEYLSEVNNDLENHTSFIEVETMLNFVFFSSVLINDIEALDTDIKNDILIYLTENTVNINHISSNEKKRKYFDLINNALEVCCESLELTLLRSYYARYKSSKDNKYKLLLFEDNLKEVCSKILYNVDSYVMFEKERLLTISLVNSYNDLNMLDELFDFMNYEKDKQLPYDVLINTLNRIDVVDDRIRNKEQKYIYFKKKD